MRWLIAVTGVMLGCAASTIVGVGQERLGSQTVNRVAPFDRLSGPRIDAPEDAQGIVPLRQFCPERTDTCRKVWDYTINFVQSYTIPLRDKEVLILRRPRGCLAVTTCGGATTSWARSGRPPTRSSTGRSR